MRIRDTFALGEIQRGDDGQLSQLRYNASGSNVLGAETNLGWQPSPQWRLTAGASWYRSRFREPQRIFDDTGDGGDTVIESRDYLKTPLDRPGPAQLDAGRTVETFVALRHTGPMSVLNNRLGELHRTRSFLVTDLGARWHRHLGAQAQRKCRWPQASRTCSISARRIWKWARCVTATMSTGRASRARGTSTCAMRSEALRALLLACACCWPHRRWLRTCTRRSRPR
jgi:hypothetical protein